MARRGIHAGFAPRIDGSAGIGGHVRPGPLPVWQICHGRERYNRRGGGVGRRRNVLVYRYAPLRSRGPGPGACALPCRTACREPSPPRVHHRLSAPHQPEIVHLPFRSQSVITAGRVALHDMSQMAFSRQSLSQEDKRANDRRPFTRPPGCAFGGAGSGWRALVEGHDGGDHRARRDRLRSGHDQARAGH